VEKLAGEIGERNLVRYEALSAAANYLEQGLSEAGYKAERNEFQVATPYGPRPAYNLVAELKGTQRPKEIVIVGAHYDSREGTPGADDNASGTAAALSLARTFAKTAPGRTIRFVFFTNEEYFRQSLMGSLTYAKLCRARNDNIVAMLSLETIGYFSDVAGSQKYPFPINLLYPSTGDFLGFVGNLGSRSLVRAAIGSFRTVATLPSQGAAAPEFIEGIGWSDQWSFWRQGYRGIMITDTAPFRNPNYHEPTDTPETLDYGRLARVVEGVETVVRDLAGVK
jgi:Zn-dependent M28 family amino/carboxypeptidase